MWYNKRRMKGYIMENYEKKMNSKLFIFFEWVYRLIMINLLTIVQSGILFGCLALMISVSFWKIFFAVLFVLCFLFLGLPSFVACLKTIQAPIVDGVFKVYYQSFAHYYKKSLPIGLLLFVVLAVSLYAFYFYSQATSSTGACKIYTTSSETLYEDITYSRSVNNEFKIMDADGSILFTGKITKQEVELENASTGEITHYADMVMSGKKTTYKTEETDSSSEVIYLELTEEKGINSFLQVGFWVILVGLIFLCFLFVQTPMLLVTFESLSIGELFRTSIYVSIRYILTSLICLTFLVISLVMLFIMPLLFPKYIVGFLGTWVLLGISLPMFFAVKLTAPIYYHFKQLNIEEIMHQADVEYEEEEKNAK
jgi:uncharacterized protein (UPF0333 family)